ncbi:hypothetical protein LCGC14_1540960, partial [marine sediment metagenome]
MMINFLEETEQMDNLKNKPFNLTEEDIKWVKETFDEMTEDEKIRQETGETEADKWARIRQQEADQDKANIDYYNEERKKMVL